LHYITICCILVVQLKQSIMSSKNQLNEYVKRLKGQINVQDNHRKSLEITILNDNRIIKNLRDTIKEKNEQIESLEDALRKSKKWYQIIIRIRK